MKFAMGDTVRVGTEQGVVTGRAEYAFEEDGYQILLIDEDGLPFKEWFDGHMISKGMLQ